MGTSDLLIVAGEASGDQHGARLLTELQPLVPEVRAFGLGGDELVAAGLEAVAHSSEIAVVGIVEALKILRRAREIFDRLLVEVDRRQARWAVLIDSPDFNLRLAKQLKARGVRVIYYISPQVWAWRRGRVHTIRRLVDKMLVVFPFEADFYHRYNVDATFVGHPLVDEVPVLPHAWDRVEELPASDRSGPPFRIALLPGSRNSEIERLLPILLDSAQRLSAELNVHWLLIRAPTIPQAKLEAALTETELEIEIVSANRLQVVASCHLALCAAGTATVEVGLVGTPMVVIYKLSPWTYWMARLLAHATYACMVNVLLDREAIPELIQHDADPELISRQAADLLTDPERLAAMRADLAQLRGVLGEPGASRRAAAEVERCLASAT